MILVQTVSSLTAFDWLKISADYFLNDFSFSLLSSCRFSRRAPVTFLLLWMCPRRWEEGRGPPWSFLHLESSEGEENKIKQNKTKMNASFITHFYYICQYLPACYWIIFMANIPRYVVWKNRNILPLYMYDRLLYDLLLLKHFCFFSFTSICLTIYLETD